MIPIEKICFAVLVHENKDSIRGMLENIKFFCPNSHIVIYNGGNNPRLCDGLGYPVCPTSRKLTYGNTTIYMIEVMKWLKSIQLVYDYLINLDSDALFGKKGFEEFIANEMENVDYMGVRLRYPERFWVPGQYMRREWHKWRPIFNAEQFLGCFNVAQTYSKKMIDRILEFEKLSQVEKNLLNTHAFGTDEIVFATLTRTLGAVQKRYPENASQTIRFRPHFTKMEIEQSLLNNPQSFLFHPVTRGIQDEARNFIMSLVGGKALNPSQSSPPPKNQQMGLSELYKSVRVFRISKDQ